MDKKDVSTKELRSFGFIVGGIFSLIGLWPLVFRSASPHFWALSVGGLLVLAGAVLPRSLGPIHRLWMAIGHALGWINTRIILGLVFFGVITPMGVIRRLLGKDPLALRFLREAETYRVNRVPRERTHMRNQF